MLHSLQNRPPGGSGFQLKNLQQSGCVAADGRIVFGQQVDKIELLGLGKFAGLRDTGLKLIPRNHGLDGCEGVISLRLRLDQGAADFPIKQELIIYLPARLLETQLMFVAGRVE